MSQPVDQMYPNNPVTRQPINSSQNNEGSFGPVFIVLAVIVVISAVACVLGRLCSRRHHRVKEAHHHPINPSKLQNHGLGPKEWESRQKPSFNMGDHGDIEFGFDKRNPNGEVSNNGGAKIKPVDRYNGAHRPAVRFADNV